MLVNTIKEFIESQDMTITAIAKIAGVGRKQLYWAMNDPKRIPNGSTLKGLCEGFQLQPSAFIRLK